MKQFILTKEPADNTIRLEGSDYRYLVKVRRLAVGECFPAVLPNGMETTVRIISIDRNVLTGKCQPLSDAVSLEAASLDAVSSETASEEAQLPSILLFQALPKGEKMDLIVRQAAECGIAEIVPFKAERSIAGINAESQRHSRWERIIREARQQSGSKTATVIHKPLTVDSLLNHWKKIREGGTVGLLFHQEDCQNMACQGLEKESLHSYLNSVPPAVVLVIGPEGGFSDKEVYLFIENGFKLITIGDTVFRTETAALFCAASVRIILLERNSWELKQTKTGSG